MDVILTILLILVSASTLVGLAYRVGVQIGAERLLALQNAGTKPIPVIPAINFVNSILLPEPEDPRWCYLANPSRVQLGDVWVFMDGIAKELRIGPLDHHVKWKPDEKSNTYCEAVINAWCNRISMESIEHADFPQKDPKLKLTGV